MLNFKPDREEVVDDDSDDMEGFPGVHEANDLSDNDSDEDSDDTDDDTDGEDIADVGEEAGMSQTQENPFFQGSDDSDGDSDSFDEDGSDSDEEDKEAKENVDEEDDLIKALKAARQKKERNCPPDIKTSDLITDISFHPESELIAVGSITGDLSIFKYTNEENKLEKKLKLSKKTLRGLEFDESGKSLLTISKDKTFRILDVETWNIR